MHNYTALYMITSGIFIHVTPGAEKWRRGGGGVGVGVKLTLKSTIMQVAGTLVFHHVIIIGI